MAFDFGAFLSSVGQVAPAMSEGGEIRRQRAADAAAVSQQAQAAQDTHAARIAQVGREKALTQMEQQQQQLAANKMTPIGEPTRDARDNKYYRTFLTANGQLARYPIEGYDPQAEKEANLQNANKLIEEMGIEPKSELANQVRAQALGVKLPNSALPRQVVRPDGTVEVYDPRNPQAGATPVKDSSGNPLKRNMPSTGSTRTGQHFYIDQDNQLREVPYTTTTTKNVPGMNAPMSGISSPPASGGKRPAAGGAAAPPQTDSAGKVIGPSKLSTAERATIQTDKQLTGFADEVLPQIEKSGMQNANGPTDSIRALKAWGEYKAGFVPSDPFYASIIAPVAAIGIAGAAPWVRIGRNKYTFEVIQQHLPHPWQTPARIYANTKWLRDNVIPSSERSILNPLSQGTAARDTINKFAGTSKPPEDEVIVVSPEEMRKK